MKTDPWKKYLDGLHNEARAVVVHVLEMVPEMAPDATAGMPYGVPGFMLDGKPLIAVASHKEHYGVYPFSPAVIEHLEPLLEGLDTAKGTIRFPYDRKPSRKLIREILSSRSEEIRA